jgi:hypothetical protein
MSLKSTIVQLILNATASGKALIMAVDAAAQRALLSVYSAAQVDTELSGKQATLVSGTNLKTINSTSLLGSGNITVGLSGTGSTDNAVLRADGTGGSTLQNSPVTISDAGQIMCVNGSASVPGLAIGATNQGIFTDGVGLLCCTSGIAVASIGRNTLSMSGIYGIQVRASDGFGWGTIGTTVDTALIRSAAGVVKVTDGVTGFGSITAKHFIAQPFTVGTLPSASANDGAMTRVTDSSVAASGNYGSIVSSGGANKVKVFSDGTNWVIA